MWLLLAKFSVCILGFILSWKVCLVRLDTTNILKLLVITINLHIVNSKQKSTYWELNLALTSSIYFLFLPLEMQKKNQTDQSILLLFLLCLRRSNPQPLKMAAAKSRFSNVYVIGTTCFDECFLFRVITRRHYF